MGSGVSYIFHFFLSLWNLPSCRNYPTAIAVSVDCCSYISHVCSCHVPPFGGSEEIGRSLLLQIVHLYNVPNPDQIICLEKFKETLKSKFLFLFISQTKEYCVCGCHYFEQFGLQNFWITLLLLSWMLPSMEDTGKQAFLAITWVFGTTFR